MGNVVVPHSVGAVGHSDADVLLHAIVDALLSSRAAMESDRPLSARRV